MKRLDRGFRGLLCGVVLLLGSAAAAADSGLAGTSMWSGQYSYSDGRAAVPFTLTLRTDAGGSFTGFTTEPNTFVNGTLKALTADVSGSFTGTRIHFKKSYDGSGGQNHSVEYSGVLGPDGHTLSGTWKLDNLTGSFSAERVSP